MNLGNKIKTFRQKRKMTLVALANAAELSKGFLSDLENGKRDVSAKNLVKLADVLHVTPNDLLEFEATHPKLKTMQLCDELAIERGLKIREYPGKWKTAKDIALHARKDKYAEESAFELACRNFLELGGEMSANFYGLLNSEIINEQVSDLPRGV